MARKKDVSRSVLEQNLEPILVFLKKAEAFGRDTFQVAVEEATRVVGRLVEKGQMTEEEARGQVDELLTRLREGRSDIQSVIDARIRRFLRAMSIPSKGDLQALEDRLDNLIARVDALIAAREKMHSADSSGSRVSPQKRRKS